MQQLMDISLSLTRSPHTHSPPFSLMEIQQGIVFFFMGGPLTVGSSLKTTAGLPEVLLISARMKSLRFFACRLNV